RRRSDQGIEGTRRRRLGLGRQLRHRRACSADRAGLARRKHPLAPRRGYAPSRPARPPTEPSPSEETPRALAAPPRPSTPTREDDALRLARPLAMIEPVRPRTEPVAAPFPMPVSASTTEQRN